MKQEAEIKLGYKKTKLGWIPEDWFDLFFGKIATLKGRIGWRGYTIEDLRDEGPLVIGATQITPTHKLDLSDPVFISKDKFDESPEIKIVPGDILLIKTGNTIGKCAIIRNNIGPACINPNTVIIRNHKCDSDFLYHWMTSELFQKQIWSWVVIGAQPSVNQENIRAIRLCLPSIPEQKKIAEILSTWDDAIQKQQELVEKKKQLKKGLMQQLLTGKKRFPEFVKSDKMKKTKLGWIPEDWEIKSISDLFEIRGRVGWKGYKQIDLRDSGPYTIGAKHIGNDNRLELTDPTYISKEKYEESPEIMIQKDDLLMVQRGSLGKVALIDREIGEATINPSMVILRQKGQKLVRFFYYMLLSNNIQTIIKNETGQTGVPMIAQKQIGSFSVPLPPLPEQKKIAEILASADDEILSLEIEIDLLKTQKKGLMQQLLTGNTRVIV